jgi:hypothetical protein
MTRRAFVATAAAATTAITHAGITGTLQATAAGTAPEVINGSNLFYTASEALSDVIHALFPKTATQRLLDSMFPDIGAKVHCAISNSFFTGVSRNLMKLAYMNPEDRDTVFADHRIYERYSQHIAHLALPPNVVPKPKTLLDPGSLERIVAACWQRLDTDVRNDDAHWIDKERHNDPHLPDWYKQFSPYQKATFEFEQDFIRDHGFPLARFHPRELFLEWTKVADYEVVSPTELLERSARNFGSAYKRAYIDARTFQYELGGLSPDDAQQQTQSELDNLTGSPFFTMRRMPPPFALIRRPEQHTTFEFKLVDTPTPAYDHSSFALCSYLIERVQTPRQGVHGFDTEKLGIKFRALDTLRLTVETDSKECDAFDKLQTISRSIKRDDVFAVAALEADKGPKQDAELSGQWMYNIHIQQPTP